MSLKSFPELLSLLSRFQDTDADTDEELSRSFASTLSSDQRRKVIEQLRLLVTDEGISLEALGSESNRWFADLAEARSWLTKLKDSLEGGADATDELVVKDSNGARLIEGDTVLVIKDLKVKGGASDLKRGTLIKKIHLIDDVEAIECRVGGSTLVLKTCFLKKA